MIRILASLWVVATATGVSAQATPTCLELQDAEFKFLGRRLECGTDLARITAHPWGPRWDKRQRADFAEECEKPQKQVLAAMRQTYWQAHQHKIIATQPEFDVGSDADWLSLSRACAITKDNNAPNQ